MDNPSCCTAARTQILEWLKRNAPSLAELYEGAVVMFHDSSLPGRTRFISHAVREIRNRLPDAFGGGTGSQRLDYTKRVNAISAAWPTTGPPAPLIPADAEHCSPSNARHGVEHVEIPAAVHRLIDGLVADHRNVSETRAGAANRFFEACAPENRELRETMQPVIRHWMAVTDWFMDRTHDSGNPDAACDPIEFRRRFEQFESILGSLIGGFFASLDELDVILAASDVGQVDRAIALIARAEHHRYFFDKLNDTGWVAPLFQKGFFRTPPPLIAVQGGPYFKAPPWPESRFLARIAGSATAEQQVRIVDIALAIANTENVSVQQDLAEIALAVPPAQAVRLVPKAKKWMNNFTFLLVPLRLGELAIHLARGGHPSEALDLTRRLLSPAHTPRETESGQAVAQSPAVTEPRPRFEPLFYGEILKNNIPELVRATGFPAFDMLCSLLASAIHSRVRDENGRREDYSTGWRPAIEDHDDNLPARDLRAMLVEAVRNAAEQLPGADPGAIPTIVQALEQRDYPVFERIALHVLRVRDDAPLELVRDRLIRRDLFDSSPHRHEYALLLQQRFGALAPADRDHILGWIEAGPGLQRFIASHESWFGRPPSAEEIEVFADHYRLERLWPIRGDLPEAWRQRLAALTARYGQPDVPEFLNVVRFEGATLEDRSPKTVAEMRQMSVEEIAEYVRRWQPPGGFRGPTREGLRFVLLKLVSEEPQRFASASQILEGLPSAHQLTALEGLREAIKAGRTFAWPGLLDLCDRALRQIDAESSAEHIDQPRGEPSPIIDAIAGLLESALEQHPVPIPYDQRQIVERILQRLAASPDTRPGVTDSVGADGLTTAPFDRPTRVKTIEAIVSYAVWVARQLSAGHPDITLPGGLDAIPAMRDILVAHLDRDRYPALAVRSFFGRSLPKLATLDAPWTERNLPQIFSTDESSLYSYQAAWRGYIFAWKYPYPNVFRMLRPVYELAVDHLEPATAQERQAFDPDTQLARHLMAMYWLGEIDFGREDGLLERFFARSDDARRAEAVQYLGMALVHEPSVPPEVLERLRRLWEIRRDATKGQPGHACELAAFGWWAASGKFDESWSTDQLTDLLSHPDRVTPDGRVLQWLANVAGRRPRDAVRCLDLFAEHCNWDFRLEVWNGDVVSILRAALRSPGPEARKAAQALIDRLGSRGLRQFRSLLQDDGGPDQP